MLHSTHLGVPVLEHRQGGDYRGLHAGNVGRAHSSDYFLTRRSTINSLIIHIPPSLHYVAEKVTSKADCIEQAQASRQV